MSFWSDFRKSFGGDKDAMEKIVDRLSPWNILKRNIQQNTKNILTTGKAVASVIPEPVKKGLGQVAGQLGKGITAPFQAISTQIGAGPGSAALAAGAKIGTTRLASQVSRESGTDLNAFLKDGMVDYAAQTAAEAAVPYDPLLQIAIQTEEKAFSPYVKRPISTAALLTDPESPLFEDDAYGKGIQFSDIQTAYNRSKDVSLGIALTKSYLNPFHITGISDAILEDGGIDIDRVNLWNDADIEANFTDNTTGRWLTGATDALIGNAAIIGSVSISLSAAKAAARAAGLSNKLNVYDVNAISKLEKLADDQISGRETTVFGTDVVNLANTKDIVLINKILKPHTNNPRLAALVKETEDPNFVRDLLLADKGYAPAIERLMLAKKADDLWYLSDAAAEISADFMKNNAYRSYNNQARERWSQAFDDAIAKNPESERIFNAFLRDEFDVQTGAFLPQPRVLGQGYKPVEPVIPIVRKAVAKVRTRKQELAAATQVRDYSNVGGISQILIGSGKRGGAATALVQFVGGKLPRGFVTHSGLRPGDAIEELNAWLDDIPLFARGTNAVQLKNGSTINASEYRRNLIDKVLVARTDAERELLFQQVNKEVAIDTLATMGLSRNQAQKFIDEFSENLTKYHSDLRRDSFAMDPSGVRTVIDPQTQRQIASSTPLIPVGKIVRSAEEVAGAFGPTKEFTRQSLRNIFEGGNKIFSLMQLVRPSYIPKNSLFEPFNAALMSQGSKFITDSTETLVKNTLFNNKQRFNQLVNKANIKSAARRKAVKEEYGLLTEQYDKAVDIVDNAVAEWVEFFVNTGARSPATRAENAAQVADDLRAAERLINNLEGKMRQRAREFGLQREEVPTLYGLIRRVQYLKTLKDPKIAAEVSAAELAITRAAGDINTLAPNLNTLNTVVKNAYDDIDALLVSMGPTRKELADEFSVVDNARIRRRGRQEEENYVLSNGQTVPLPRLENQNHFGTAYKAEISNRNTREIEILGDKQFATRTQMLGRRTANNITDVTNPLYFDELAYTVNNYMRGDQLIDQILAGRSRNEIIQTWGLKRPGRSYADEFGRDASDIIDIIDDQISYVNRYLPTLEAKAAALQGEVRGNQLAQLLGDKLDRLTPINPLENKYATPVMQAKGFLDGFDRLSSKAWAGLSAPENIIRWAWGSVELKQRIAQKLELLASQGYDITTGTANSVRQAAAIEMVKEAEKTFYSIRRQNRALFASRTVLAFPNASASGIYRYTRFAAKSPERMSGFLNSYYGIYNSFGVDKYGNPVEDVLDAEYLMIPGTKELGLKQGRGIMVGTRAINFLANFAGPSYVVPAALGQVLALKPGNDEILRKSINETLGKLPGYSYEELFPYGLETDIGKAALQVFTPAYLRNYLLYLNGDDSKKEWVDSYTSEWNYQMALYDMGIGKKPTDKSVTRETKKKFFEKAAWQFASIVGTPAVVDARPDSIFSTYFRNAVDKYKAQGMSDRDAKAAAEVELNTQVSAFGAKNPFPMERLYYGAKRRSKAAYVIPTVEGYKRVWEEFSGLAKDLAEKDKNLVGLITADLAGEKADPNISRILNKPNVTLPDGTTLNLPLKPIKDVENDIEASRVWEAYRIYKEDLNARAVAKGFKAYSESDELKFVLANFVTQLGELSPYWKFQYDSNKREDTAYKYAWGLTKIVNNKAFMKKHGNTPFWQDAAEIMAYRDSFSKLRSDAPDGSKIKVNDGYEIYINSILPTIDPKLANIISRYFINDSLREVSND
jgi:hypothetical protein